MRRFCLWVAILFCLVQCTRPSKTISIAWDPSWNSISVDAPAAHLTGFFNDLLLEISKEHHHDCVFKVYERSWTDLKEGLLLGQYEVIAMNHSPQPWEGGLVFSEPLIPTGVVLVVAKRSSERSLADLANQEVGLLMDDETLTLIGRYESIYPRFYPSVAPMLEDLKEGRIAGALTPVLAAEAYLEDLYAVDLSIVSKPLTRSAIMWVGTEESSQTLEELSKLTRELQSKGEYAALLKKWNLEMVEPVR